MSLSTIEGIRQKFSNRTIHVLSSRLTKDVYALSPAVDLVEDLENGQIFSGTQESLMIILPLSFRSALTVWMKRFPNRIGYASEGRSLLLTKALDYQMWKSRHLHQSSYYRELAESVLGSLPVLSPRLVLPEKLLNHSRAFLEKNNMKKDPLIAVNPGAYYGSAKMWPVFSYISLIQKILEALPRAGIILFSGEKDSHVTREIMSRIGNSRLISTDGKLQLSESIGLLSCCHYLISNDSGMMHLGAALDMKGIAFFGPTDPVTTAPQSGKIRILREPVRCSPCFLRYCPIDHRCMELLTPEYVWDTIREEVIALER